MNLLTIKDLAAKTGYAVGTVSRALNGLPNVSDKAREAILEAARESGFQLNQNAKQLKQTRTTNILMVVKGTRNELFGELVEVIQAKIAGTRYQLVVDYLDEDQNEVLRALQLIAEKKPLGVLFLGGNDGHFPQDFSPIDIPCVLLTNDASKLPFPNLSSVSIDDRAAAREALEALIALGHRRVAIIGGDRSLMGISHLRWEGCLDALRANNIPFDPEKDYLDVRYSYQEGYRAAKTLFARDRGYTALFTAADVIAIGAIRALGELGLRVPEDVSVMGIDGLPLGQYLMPSLSTVVQPARTLGERGVELLLAAIEEGAPPRHETVPFTIAKRESLRALTTMQGEEDHA